MAETPEEVARRVTRAGGDCEHMNPCDCMEQAIASALRAQYVAGLEAAIAVCRGNIINGQIRAGACIEAICVLVEQAKEK